MPFALLTFFLLVYNKWHETELERWLSDHNVPYPTPSDRKDLENLVKDNWQSKIASPYNDWDTNQLTSYLSQKGVDTKDSAAATKDSLVAQVKNVWFETETGGKPENVLAGYQLDGKPIHKDDHSMAFTACLGVAAMSDAKHQAWLNSLWDYVVTSDSEDDRYFGRTLKMLSLVAMSGNWWSPGG